MTYEEFIKSVKEAGVYLAQKKGQDVISVSWSLGGSSGNCWNDKMDHYSAEAPEELDGLDIILEAVAPAMTFLQYKNLVREVVTYREEMHSDYYGGSSSTAIKECDLRVLYNRLVERKILKTVPSKVETPMVTVAVHRRFRSGKTAKTPVAVYKSMTMEQAREQFYKDYTNFPENYMWDFVVI